MSAEQARVAPTLEDALELAVEAHRGQIYPSPEPEPYILHPIRVMLGVRSRTARVVAVLHDVVEDTSVTLTALEDRGFSRTILDALDCVSRRPGEAYEDYIRRLAPNSIAREVKLSDLRDNLANNRALPPTEDNLARIVRYERAQRALRRSEAGPRTAA
jgi:(p)ppGpp synthase/HD superfamily hydrolase